MAADCTSRVGCGYRAGNADRLQRVALIQRLGDAAGLRGSPVDRLVGEFDASGRNGAAAGRGAALTRLERAGGRRPRRYRGSDHGSRGRRRNGGPRRNQPGHPVQQRCRVRRHADRSRKRLWIIGRHAVDDGQAGIRGGAVAGIDPAVNAGGEHHAAALLQPDEPIPPGRIVGGQSFARDGDQAAALGETRQRRADMAQRRIRHPAFHMGRRRERRVHQHHGRTHRRIEMVVDVGGVIARDGNVLEQLAEQAGAGGGEFVKDQMTAGQFGKDRKKTGPGRGLQHQIRGRDRGGRRSPPGRARAGWRIAAAPGSPRSGGCATAASAATLASMASRAAGALARARIAGPNLRRNSTCAASQAS